MDVECSLSGHPSGQKMLSAHDEPEDESILAEEFVPGEEDYELTELKNVGTEEKSIHLVDFEEKPLLDHQFDQEDELEPLEEFAEEDEELEDRSEGRFTRSDIKLDQHLANAIRHYPALYDASDANYHSNQNRQSQWKKISEALLWQNDTESLHRRWLSLKERYIRRYDKGDPNPELRRLWDSMKWLDRFILPHHEKATISRNHNQQQPSQGHSGARSLYVDEPQTVAQDVMIGGGQSQPPSSSYASSHSSHRDLQSHVVQQPPSSQSELRGTSSSSSSGSAPSYILLKGANPSGHIRLVDTHTIPRVVVPRGSANGNTVLHIPSSSYSRNTRVQLIQAPSSSSNSSYEQRVNVGDPGVTVTERGTVNRPIHIKKEQLILDNGEYYQSGSSEQKFVRVINMHDGIHHSPGMGGGPLKRMRIIRTQNPSHGQQVNIVQMPSTSRCAVPMAALGEEVIIDDGVSDRIVIDPDVQPESPLLSESPGMGSMMISGQHGLGPPSPSGHPGYLQQSQYDADLQFQQQISSRMTAYDDNDKAIIKYYIQKILLESRFNGEGFLSKVLDHEEELDGGANGVSHELISP